MDRTPLVFTHWLDLDALGNIAITFELLSPHFGTHSFQAKVCSVIVDRLGQSKLSDFPRAFDGIFVMDVTFGVGGRLHWTRNVAEVLYVVWLKTGLHCAVIRVDASIKRGLLPEPLALRLMHSILVTHFDRIGFVVWIGMNSVLQQSTPEYPTEQLAKLCNDLLQGVPPYVCQCMVYGGGSRIMFNEGAPMAHPVAYDQGVSSVVNLCRRGVSFPLSSPVLGVGIMSGDAIFGDIVFNNIGRYGMCTVHHEQLIDVIKAFVVLTNWGMRPWVTMARL